MAGWHHRLNGHEFEQTPGNSEGQGSLVCCSLWGRKEWDRTEQLNNSSVPCTRNNKLLMESPVKQSLLEMQLFSLRLKSDRKAPSSEYSIERKKWANFQWSDLTNTTSVR